MKHAYPNFSADDSNIKPIYNLNRWLTTMREIYAQSFYGKDRGTAFQDLTKEWNEVEKQDFSAWMKFYEGGNQFKYKTAQLYMNENVGGYFLPNPKSAPPSPLVSLQDPVEISKTNMQEQLTQEQKRRIIEDQRRKMLGRLTSLEKLLGSKEGHMLVGSEFEKLFTTINDLKRQIHLVNKISLSNQLYQDLIIREANKLSNSGLMKAAGVLYKFAQNTPGNFDAAQGPLPLASKIDNQGTLPNTIPMDALQKSPNEEKNPLDELLDNLETGGLTETDENKSEDEEEVQLEENKNDADELMVEAQLAPDPLPVSKTMPPKDVVELPPPVEELAVGAPQEKRTILPAEEKDIDAMINSALSKITVEDVIEKIEDVNAIFQNRTIARELAIIDLMLARLGLSSYFTNLSEIIQKNHESSNYSISRLSDMLGKLRGAIGSNIDLDEKPKIFPETHQVQQQLEQQKNKDEQRKQMKRQLEDESIQEKLQEQAPIPQLGPELAQQPPPTLAPNV